VRLWQRLFFAFAALSGLALLGFVAWQQQNFRRGFLSYLDEVAVQRLEPARKRLTSAYAEHASWDFLRGDPAALGELIEPGGPGALRRLREDASFPPEAPPGRSPSALEATDGREGPPGAAMYEPPPGERAPPEPGGRPPPEPGDRSEGRPGQEAPVSRRPGMAERDPEFREHDPRRGPPRMHGPPDLMPRLLLVDAEGTPVAGNPAIPADALALPLLLDGRPIGTLRLARQSQINAAVDLAFSRTQTRDALIVGVAILLGALILAFALARWLLAPVRALAAATQALAAGDFGQRVSTARTDELGALAQDFNRLAATLERHREARQRWAADIAHELRTPLSVLRGEIQALQDGVRALTPQALDSLHADCARLGSLIEDLYQLSLADAGALDYHFAPLDLDELVRDTLAQQQRACVDAGLTLEDSLAVLPPVRGDARRLTQLVDNLLANARHYTNAPGRVRVEVAAVERRAQLIVEDTEPGVPAASLPRLFERLYRVESSRARSAGGAGLGLSICRAIVDAHGGTIEAQHSLLGGLRIIVRLPFADGAPA
jgi:two-component system sensor histidine kinase BaeS